MHYTVEIVIRKWDNNCKENKIIKVQEIEAAESLKEVEEIMNEIIKESKPEPELIANRRKNLIKAQKDIRDNFGDEK